MSDEKEHAPSLRDRLKQFALRIIQLCASLERNGPADVIGRQLVRSGTSVGAQHREAYRARSTAEFISKVGSAIQELDETVYWLELLADSGLVKQERLANLRDEAEQLLRILVASVKTAKRSRRPEKET